MACNKLFPLIKSEIWLNTFHLKKKNTCKYFYLQYEKKDMYYLLFIEVEGGIDIYGSVESGECVKQPISANVLTKQTDTVSLGRNRFKTKRNKTFLRLNCMNRRDCINK